MRDQYAGDVSDVVKFGLLRALAGDDRKLGIAWYYVPGHDGRRDGRHREWRGDPSWKQLDAELYKGLDNLPEPPSIAALERADIWPKGTLFHGLGQGEEMPPWRQRTQWADAMRAKLESTNLVFLDPDNGVGKRSKKHATMAEIQSLLQPRRAVVFISFPGFSVCHQVLARRRRDEIFAGTKARHVVTLRTNVSVPRAPGLRQVVQRPRWFTVIDPDALLVSRIEAFAEALRRGPRVRAWIDEQTR